MARPLSVVVGAWVHSFSPHPLLAEACSEPHVELSDVPAVALVPPPAASTGSDLRGSLGQEQQQRHQQQQEKEEEEEEEEGRLKKRPQDGADDEAGPTSGKRSKRSLGR